MSGWLQTILNWLFASLSWIWGKVTDGITWVWASVVLFIIGFVHAAGEQVFTWASAIISKIEGVVMPSTPDFSGLTYCGNICNTFFPLNELVVMVAVFATLLIACTVVKIIRFIIRLCWMGVNA